MATFRRGDKLYSVVQSSKHFGNVLFPFLASLANARRVDEAPAALRDACIAHEGSLMEMYKYIQKLREVTPMYVIQTLMI
jgi:hypothetical protein